MINYTKDSRGISILIALVILGALVATAAGVASVFVKEIRISSFVDDSIFAIMAADAGIEKQLYDIKQLSGSPLTSYSAILDNGATYTTCPELGSCLDGPSIIIQSVGVFNNIRRSLEVSF
jgi:Tfp pilus assembly protein PilX